MPVKPIDYSKTHFYKIVCKDLNIKDCYVGHTTDFTKRKSNHKRAYTNENDRHYNIYLYQFICENGGLDNFDMVLIQTVKCENGMEARAKEREHIVELNATLNKVQRPIVSQQEEQERKKQWKENNKGYVKQRDHQYYENNKERYAENSKQYRENIRKN